MASRVRSTERSDILSLDPSASAPHRSASFHVGCRVYVDERSRCEEVTARSARERRRFVEARDYL